MQSAVSAPAATAARRARLRARAADEALDAFLVTRTVNVRWLTGFTGSNGQLLVHPDGEVLVTDGRYAEQAGGEAEGVEVVLGAPGAGAAERLSPGARLGVESHDLSWDQARRLRDGLEGVEVVAAPRWVEALREAKDLAEVEVLTQACGIADDAFAAMLEWLRPGLTELEIARRLDDELRDRGAQGPSFQTIVASGPNSARPHHQPTARRLERGDVLKTDFGALLHGYHGDMTRTVAIGEPPAELRTVHELVRTAQEAGRAAVADGATAGDVDRACREVIEAAGHGEHFVHPTGHGVGLEIHEEPVLHEQAVAILRPGMAVTVEPGVYLPGVGGVRIEDVVVVLEPGEDAPAAEVLTRAPRDLLVL
jgi:Xaa-Pro aminopeptidase